MDSQLIASALNLLLILYEILKVILKWIISHRAGDIGGMARIRRKKGNIVGV